MCHPWGGTLLRKHPLLWSVLLAVLPLLGWWTYGLFDLDEGFYGAVAVEMNRRGEWITPFYNGQPWFEKPILLYWLAKPSIALFGIWFGPRLPSILATIATYCLTGWFTKRHYGPAAAVFSVLALGSSLLIVGVGRMMLTDPLLNLCMAAAFFTFWESLDGDPRWRLATAAALGFGVLAKGPIAGILFIPPTIYLFARFPERRPQFKGMWVPGVLIFLAIVASWYLPAYLVDGHMFIQKFLVEQNLNRFTGGDEAHNVPLSARFVFYIPIFLVGFAPWSVVLFRTWKTPVGDPTLNRYLWVCLLTVFIFFTITSAKLVHYIAPMGPPLAVLVGAWLAEKAPLTAQRLAPTVAWLLAVAVIAEGGFYGWDLAVHHREIQDLALYVRDHASPSDQVVEYEMGKQPGKPSVGPVKINETSQPSTVMILDRTVTNLESWPDILKLEKPAWILTRNNRISPEELKEAGPSLRQIETPLRQDLYRLYYWSPSRKMGGTG